MIYFISDLHLDESRPATAQAFLDFLAGPVRQGQALWILGDLFEFWTGDEEVDTPFNRRIADALSALRGAGVDIKLVIGNRDFLLGRQFAKRCGLQIVDEPAQIDLGGHRTVLLHGDAQCTDDVSYQRFRAKVRSPWRQFVFCRLPFWLRLKITRGVRNQIGNAKQLKEMRIMDVNDDAIAQVFRDSGASWMIHGHTHRPARHDLVVDGQARVRWVLADWHDKATWLEWNGQALQAREA
ncbi:UDP-2,3-diacylglucosamine diphosphatase [Uliginosibacterium sp. H1]|uniref:UDP-2,3-diacylglucosamine diphosphatase n=1 Tax=Uliginosibacterium sp. H1 TaxID=3114757 RepID=UPI002E194092|nr:UDP-2,3-diacylglucosamine diphosphatase [Uliginosibacterium sp. H1]